MVLASTGYGIGSYYSPMEPTYLVEGNQLLVEHRCFNNSTPQPTDWRLLNIEQAAADHHRIVQAFKPLFPGKWISKGGMTSLYHRAFFPRDVDATGTCLVRRGSSPFTRQEAATGRMDSRPR
ncbi:hypothetical protein [Corallococcus sp. RDP092CA]|uniref:hypothetical protein n=1 Tax=Corallococcus sp. RDP092CA TaxID=3109369 RepID=UPI0035AEE5B8